MRTELAKKLLEVFTSNEYKLEYVYANSEKGLLVTFRNKTTQDLVEWGIDGEFIGIERDGFYKPVEHEKWIRDRHSLRLDSISRCELLLRDNVITFKGFRKGLSFFKFDFNLEPSDCESELQESLLYYVMNGNEIEHVFSINNSIYRLFDSMAMIGTFIGKRLIDRIYLAVHEDSVIEETKNEEQRDGENKDSGKQRKKIMIGYRGESPDDVREAFSPIFDIEKFSIEEISPPFLAFALVDLYSRNPAADLPGWNELSVYSREGKYYAISSFDEGVFARAVPVYSEIKLYVSDMKLQEEQQSTESEERNSIENNDSETLSIGASE